MSKAKLIFKSKAKKSAQALPQQKSNQAQKQKEQGQKVQSQQKKVQNIVQQEIIKTQQKQQKFIQQHGQSPQKIQQAKQKQKQTWTQKQKNHLIDININVSINSQLIIVEAPRITQIQLSQQQRLRRNVAQLKKRKLLQIMQAKSKQQSFKNKSKTKPVLDFNNSLNNNQKQKEQKQQQQKNQQQKQNDLNNSRICKHKGKHFKIYNEQHFKVQDQIKTSIHRWEYGNGFTPNKILISSWNLNGIRARYNNNDIQPYVGKIRPDIFCVNQHKMDQKSYDQLLIKFPGYFSYWNFSKISLAYSGVAIFSKYPAISMVEDMPQQQKSFNMEGRVITLQFQKFVIVNAYIPTSGKQLERLMYRTKIWDPVFTRYVAGLKQKYKGKIIIVCGDLNVSHQQIDCHTGAKMKQNRQPSYTLAQRFNFSKLLQTGFIDTFRALHPTERAYSWWNLRRGGRKRVGSSGTGIGKRLDYFLITKQHFPKVLKSSIQKQWDGNDHCPIQLQIDFSINEQKEKTKQVIQSTCENQKMGQNLQETNASTNSNNNEAPAVLKCENSSMSIDN